MMKSHLRRTLLAVSCLILSGLAAFAQQKVSGTVRDSKGVPVIGAGVVVEGTQTGTMTDMDGAYSLSVPANAKLVASCVGYTDASATVVSGRSVYDFVLEESSTFLDDVVVIGYQTVKRRDLTGSVSSVNSKQLSVAPVSNVAQALQGKLAGVNIVSQDGRPDATINIRVRGGGSISQSNEPLILIDGVSGT